ncbi:hypothetical protein B0H14DRAFT_3536146 [Mycena olivaceomarginata]|nr:hypothetical protein B0H14DRAFT_3536146 [Mycena olivaceomarginata]
MRRELLEVPGGTWRALEGVLLSFTTSASGCTYTGGRATDTPDPSSGNFTRMRPSAPSALHTNANANAYYPQLRSVTSIYGVKWNGTAAIRGFFLLAH